MLKFLSWVSRLSLRRTGWKACATGWLGPRGMMTSANYSLATRNCQKGQEP